MNWITELHPAAQVTLIGMAGLCVLAAINGLTKVTMEVFGGTINPSEKEDKP